MVCHTTNSYNNLVMLAPPDAVWDPSKLPVQMKILSEDAHTDPEDAILNLYDGTRLAFNWKRFQASLPNDTVTYTELHWLCAKAANVRPETFRLTYLDLSDRRYPEGDIIDMVLDECVRMMLVCGPTPIELTMKQRKPSITRVVVITD